MRSLLPERRAAEELDAALEGHARPEVVARHAELVSAVQRLREAPAVAPRAEFVADLRERLMAAAAAELPAATTTRPPRTAEVTPLRTTSTPTSRSRRAAGGLAAALVVVGGTTGMAAAASGALPGDPLYPIKRGGEAAAQVVHFTDAAKGRAQLGQAETRLSEVDALLRAGRGEQVLVPATLDSFTAAATEGSDRLFAAYDASGDAADIAAVRDFTASQMTRIEALVGDVGAEDSGVLLDAADALAQIDQEASERCGTCAAGDPVLTPAALSQGAGAAALDQLLAQPVSQALADVAAVQAARRADLDRVADLAQKAQDSAAGTPLGVPLSPGTTTPQAGVTPAGELVPGTTGRVVEDLLTGVTGTLGTVGTVGGLTGTVKGATDGLGQTLDGATGGATSPLTDGLGGLTGDLSD